MDPRRAPPKVPVPNCTLTAPDMKTITMRTLLPSSSPRVSRSGDRSGVVISNSCLQDRRGRTRGSVDLQRGAGEESLLRPEGDTHESDEHRNFDEGPDHRRKGRPAVNAEAGDGNGDGELEVVRRRGE